MVTNKIAWAAGLFEGEGTLTLNGKTKSPRLKLSMTDFDVVRRFAAIVKVGHLCVWKDKNRRYQKQLCWYTGKKTDVIRVTELLLPYFGERRTKQAARVLARAMKAPFEGWDGPRIKELVGETYA